MLKVEASKSGHIDGCVGGGVDANDGDVLEVEQTVQTHNEDEDGNDHQRHGAGTVKPFGVKRGKHACAALKGNNHGEDVGGGHEAPADGDDGVKSSHLPVLTQLPVQQRQQPV